MTISASGHKNKPNTHIKMTHACNKYPPALTLNHDITKPQKKKRNAMRIVISSVDDSDISPVKNGAIKPIKYKMQYIAVIN